MRLADFIASNTESILQEWEDFARSIWPKQRDGEAADVDTLRDHAEILLHTVVEDMGTDQTDDQQEAKGKGRGEGGEASEEMDDVSSKHAAQRARSGFDLQMLIAEYRALRASVMRLWTDAGDEVRSDHDADDVTRFNEAIDQSLTEAVEQFTGNLDRSRETFLGILGHDLRSPLNAITLASQLLHRQSDGEANELSQQIISSARHMASMIDDLLDFAGAGLGGTLPIRRDECNLSALARDVLGEVRSAHPDATFELETHGDLTGDFDPGRLRQLLANLLNNAAQHGDPAQPITLTADGRGGDEVVLTIHNAGQPIASRKLAHLFEPMQRAGEHDEDRPHRRPGSIGLGLFIAKAVAVAHGGTIDVTSTQADGTTFTVHLPRQSS